MGFAGVHVPSVSESVGQRQVIHRTCAKPPQRRSNASPYSVALSSAFCLAGALLRKSKFKTWALLRVQEFSTMQDLIDV